jgi:hypothetical protein
MSSAPRTRWSSTQKAALDEAKAELRVFLTQIGFKSRMNRKEQHGEEKASVIGFRDQLIERLMGMRNLGGNNVFTVEKTRVRAFTILECQITHQVLAECNTKLR